MKASSFQSVEERLAPVVGRLLVLGTIVMGAIRASGKPLWFDEAVTAAIVRRPAVPFLNVIFNEEAGMTPYYVALWVWAQVFGSDFGLAMFSVVGGALAIWLVHRLLEKRCGNGTAAVGGLLMLCNPFFLDYLTEIRAYSWIMALAAGALWMADRWEDRRGAFEARCLGVLCGLLVATHVANGPFVILLILGTFTLWPPKSWRKFASTATQSALILALVAAAALPAVLANPRQVSWIPKTDADWAYSQTRIFLGGTALSFGIMSVLVVGASLAVLMYGESAPRARIWWLCAVASPALLAVASLLEPVLLSRYLSVSFPALALVGAWAISMLVRATEARVLRVSIWGLIGAMLLVTMAMQRPLASSAFIGDARAAADWVDNEVQVRGVVLVSAHDALDFYHYFGYRPSVDLTLIQPPPADSVYPLRRRIVEISDSRLSGDVFVFVGYEGVTRDLVETFRGREFSQTQFERLSIVHILPVVDEADGS